MSERKQPILFEAEEPVHAEASRPAPGPLLFEHDPAAPAPDPASAPPVPEDGRASEGAAMQGALGLMSGRFGGRMGGLGSWILASALSLILLMASLAAWDWALGLMQRVPVLGALGLGLMAALGLGLLLWLGREFLGWRRLKRLDGLHRAALAALAGQDLAAAREVAEKMARHFGGVPGPELAALDADAVLEGAERLWLAGPDAQAEAEVQAAARQVALLTAMVPLALADVAAALVVNLRMIRRIATLYGGRPGSLGGWRLVRGVASHLAATGAVAVGDDMIGSALGGGLLAKLSRRFGEGVVNGALTARVGIAAIEVCRPLPFRARPRPGVTALTSRALTGLFQRG